MKREHGLLVFMLVAALVIGLTVGMNQVLAQPEDEHGEEEEEMIQTRPNPLDRPADTSAPAMRPESVLLLAEKVGVSEPAMKHGGGATGSVSATPAVPGATPGGPGKAGKQWPWPYPSAVTFEDGRKGMMQEGEGGKMQLFLMQGNSKVLAPDGNYQAQNGQQIIVSGGQASMLIDPVDSGGAVQSPGQMQMPGKMR